ncbi:MAG TPA: 2-(1,2-epoxy-1,2-dihydrophenyl)acetyl-CoA isomerase PaaG [Azospirillaceae bacterium]|nr:2-(1,2-epoxy-1,2-dihydrophenyl)acetyl-CoA isomerase PaaG [Azospirillaceae bacterium]
MATDTVQPSQADPVLVERCDGYRILTLNRPDRLNAFTEDMHKALAAALAEAEEDRATRCVVLTGAGRGFCAGADLTDRAGTRDDGPPDLGASLETHYNPLIRRIRAMPMPVVAAVNGVAAGAGANVALACDIVLAARSASFIQAFVKIGLVPDAGGTWTLPRLVGEARARYLAMTGEPVDADRAEAWGMIWRAVDDAELMPAAKRLAAQFAQAPTGALALMKEAFDRSWSNDLAAQLDLERRLQRKAGFGRDFAEGVTAFLEKRPPRFTGRP